jgi:hypothetical protein
VVFIVCDLCLLLYAGLLALTAIDGLGGVSASQSDTSKTNHQKTGCGIFFCIYSVTCCLALLYMHFELPETRGADPETMRGNDEVSFSQNSSSSPVRTKNSAPKKKMYKGSSQGLQENLIMPRDVLSDAHNL